MSWYNTHHLPSPIYLPQQGKHRPRWLHSAFAPSLPRAPYKRTAEGPLGVMADQLSPEGRQGNVRAAGTADTVGALTGERWITGNHHNQQIRVILSQSAGQGKMTLKYAQMAFYLPSRDTSPEQQ